MKRKNLICAIMLAFALALTAPSFLNAPATTVAAAKKKVALNKKKATVSVGKKFTLKVKNISKKTKVKWSSSKKAVATVSKKGVVKAKKVGKTVITAKVGKKKYKCKVVVKKASVSYDNLTRIGDMTNTIPFYKDKDGKKTAYKMTISSITVKHTTSGTTIGSYAGSDKYVITIKGNIPAVFTNDDLKYREFGITLINSNIDSDSNYYELKTVKATDEDFRGYISTFTRNAAGDFTFTVQDVSIIGSFKMFRVSEFPLRKNYYYDSYDDED